MSKIDHKKDKKFLVKRYIIGANNNKYFTKFAVKIDVKLVITIQKHIYFIKK